MRRAGILLGVFLLGLIPGWIRSVQLNRELVSTRNLADARDLVSLAYLEASRNNYGLASQYASEFYVRLAEVGQNADEPVRSTARDALVNREALMSKLTRADAGARTDLQELTARLLSRGEGGTATRARTQ
jgi:hypothetical protein